MNPESSQRSRDLVRGLSAAALLLAAAAAIKLLLPTVLGAGPAQRLVGVLLGAVVVVFANAVPKTLTALSKLHCDPASEQAMRRFVGWSLTLGGVGYLLSWLLAPLESANLTGGVLLGTAFLVAVARMVWGLAR
jgi:hypothetical protein